MVQFDAIMWNFNKTLEQGFEIEAIKQKYLREIDKRGADRNKQDIYYGQGINEGLPHRDKKDIDYDRDIQDQKAQERSRQRC